MKYIAGGILTIFVLCAYISVSVEEAHAFGISQPFGGLVTITTSGDASCNGGVGPATITPVGSSEASPYYFPAGMRTPTTGGWVLGLYDSVQDVGSCHYNDEDNTPYPVYNVSLFGTSLQ